MLAASTLGFALSVQLAAPAPAPPKPPVARTLDEYSRNIALAVAVEPDGASTRIFSGAGGDVFLLGYDRAREPELSLASASTWSTGGVVLDLALMPDFAYVAAFREGLAVFDRRAAGARVPYGWSPSRRQLDCVAAVDVKGQRLIALGTEGFDSERCGEVYLLWHDREHGRFASIASWNLGGPVFSLVATTSCRAAGADAVLFVGAGCAPGGALQRFDLALAFDEEHAKVETVSRTSWSTSEPAIVRDLVLDPQAERLYAAAFWHGVQAFDVAPQRGLLTPLDTGGWPLYLPNDPEHGLGCRCDTGVAHAVTIAHALALTRELDANGTRQLVVALAPARTDVSCVQALGDLGGVAPCNLLAAPPEAHECTDASSRSPTVGIFAFELRDGSPGEVSKHGGTLPIARLGGFGRKGNVGAIAFSLAVANESESGYDVHCANVAFGLQCLRATRGESAWSMERTAAWNASAPARLPMPAFDDLAFVRGDPDVLLAASEGGLAAFALDPRNAHPLSAPWGIEAAPDPRNPLAPWVAHEHAITLAHFDGENARVVATTRAGAPGNPGGLVLFDVRNPARPAQAGDVELDRGGFGYGLVGVRELGGDASDARRWLYTTQEVKVAGRALESWSVRLWDLGSACAPLDPTREGTQQPRVLATFETSRDERIELGGLAVVDGAEQQVAYALYEPRAPLDGEAAWSGEVGLVALRTVRRADGNVEVERLEPPRLPAFSGATWEQRSVRATLDRERHRLYAAWVGLLAIADVSDPLHPRWIARRDLRNERFTYGLVPAPVQVALGPEVDGRVFVYVALLNDGVALLDATDAKVFETSKLHVLATPWQTTSVLVDPRDPTRRRLFVAEGTRGIEWLEVK